MPPETQLLPQNQPGTGGEDFRFPEKFGDLEVPEKLRGKTAAEVLKTYLEGEKTFGQRADYDDLKRKGVEYDAQVRQLQAENQAWEQYRAPLEKLGWDVSKLEQVATGQAGPAQTQVSLERWAQQWANTTPEEQIPYLLQQVIAPLYQSAMQTYTKTLMEQLGQAFQQQQGYQAQKEKLWISWLKAAFPEKAKNLDDTYTAAMQLTQQMMQKGYDPFQAVMETVVSKQQQDQEMENVRKQTRAEVEQEFTAKQTPTMTRRTTPVTDNATRPKRREAIRNAALKAALEKAPHLAR